MKPVELRHAFRGEASLRASDELPDSIFAPPSSLTAAAGSIAAKGSQSGPGPLHGTHAAAPRRPGALAPGAILDKYRIEELLGVGAFGMVYRATHLLLQRPVALKLLRSDVLARRPRMQEALLQEARLAARIDHPNVVQVLDVTRHGDMAFLVMAYVAGPTLRQRLKLGPPPSRREALRIASDIAAGLGAGLAVGLVHRDVNPANILLAPAGSAHLTDFGLAVAEQTGGRPGPVGTPGYMAPEVAAGGAGSFRSDIYSLGVTLAECLAAGRSGQPVPAALQALLFTMRHPAPDGRPASYDQLLSMLADQGRAS